MSENPTTTSQDDLLRRFAKTRITAALIADYVEAADPAAGWDILMSMPRGWAAGLSFEEQVNLALFERTLARPVLAAHLRRLQVGTSLN